MGGKNKGADKAAQAQIEAQELAMQEMARQFNTTMEFMRPYREAGIPALQSMQYLSGPGGRADFMQDYYKGPEYAQASEQMRNQQLASAEATGGLSTQGTRNAMAMIAPTLGNQAYANQMSLLGNLAGIGQSAAAGQAQQGMGYGQQMAQLQQGIGSIMAGKHMQPSALSQAVSGGLSGAVGGSMLGPMLGATGPVGALVGGGLGLLGSLF
ncbi:MAG: DNA transfer protein [Plesiomonas shigelloides]